MKGKSFARRLGFAAKGMRVVARRERSFRSQIALAVAAGILLAIVRPGFIWTAVVALSVVLVLALEMINAALEYLIDHVHPELAAEIGHAKDAAAGAVLVASFGSLIVGGLMLAAALAAP